LLKERPSSLRLYNAYALIEWRSGNNEMAETVFSTALSMSGSLSEVDQQDSFLLWKSWAWETIQCNPRRALEIILSVCEGKVQSWQGDVPPAASQQPSVMSGIPLAVVLKARNVSVSPLVVL
jgi:hypothetical protein